MSVYVYWLTALATLIVPCLLGTYFGKRLRMPEHGWKIGLILFTTLASVVILFMGPPVKLGVDLRGGVILVYEIDQAKKEAGKKVDMDRLVAAISMRVNPGGHKEVIIRPSGIDQIEIIIPEIDEAEVDRIQKIIGRAGTLEFRILANRRDHKSLIELATALPPSTKVVKDASDAIIGWWVPLQAGQEKSNLVGDPDLAIRRVPRGDKEMVEVLVFKDNYDVTGAYLARADRDTDDKGRVCVGFSFNSTGGQLFSRLTGDNLPDPVQNFHRRLGILLDNELYSAPTIQSTISDRGIISSDSFTEQEVKDEVNVLNAGSLPTALVKEPISRLYSGPTLGSDTIEKSKRAMIIACILVPLFMLWYYRFAGIVADIALALNMLMLVAIMVGIKAAFTLTGLAGLALTVGMAVDNNVLVFERLREEMERGATLRMAIRNSFQRAGATIIDCNLTHLLAATVMYVVGTDQIRGFAVTLWIGVGVSMYTAVFVSKVIFDIAEKRQWIKELKMLHLIRHTNIDFMGWFPVCATGSILITLIGLGIAFHRGQGLFDIDFTGGVSVQAQFREKQDPAKVRTLLNDVPEAERLADLAVSGVQATKDQPIGMQFVINTSESSLEKVEQTVAKVFGDKLDRNEVTFSEPLLIQSAAKPDAAKEKPAETPVATPAEKPKEPESKPATEPEKPSQSRTDLPSNRLLAMAGDASLLLALADEPVAKSDAVEAKPAETNAAEAKPAVEVAKPAEPAQQPTATAPLATEPLPGKPAQDADAGAQANAAAIAEASAAAMVGGSEFELTFQKPLDYKTVEDLIKVAVETTKVATESPHMQLSAAGYVEGEARPFGKWTVRVLLPPEKAKLVLAAVQDRLKATPFFPASSQIGGAVAGNTQRIAILAMIASWCGIILYLWVRFQGVAFGLAAVIALVHDVLIMLGAVAASYYVAPYLPGWFMIEPFKINLPIIAAFLTIIGYSVNDTIVVFDRIREVRGKDPNLTVQMVNDSINQTMSRTLLTSVTVALVVVVLYFFGGDALHGFAFALFVGVVTGTYSSIYVAAPTLLWMIAFAKKHLHQERVGM